MQSRALGRVRRAALKASRAEENLREAGESLTAIAGVVGVTRQRIKQIIGD
jgi:hypothetical protein